MRNRGVVTTLVLSGMLVACAQRVVPPANIAEPAPAPSKAAPNPPGARPQVAAIREEPRKHSAVRTRRVVVDARMEQPREALAAKPQTSEAEREQWRDPPPVAALPPPSEPAEPTFPSIPHPSEPALGQGSIDPSVADRSAETMMPLPPEPAQPTWPAVPPVTEVARASEIASPPGPEISPKATVPPSPEPADSGFPLAALMPPPPEPAESFLPEQGEPAAEGVALLPFPELSETLSLSPRFDWREVTATFSIPRSLVAGALEANSEKEVPSLVREPWPLQFEHR